MIYYLAGQLRFSLNVIHSSNRTQSILSRMLSIVTRRCHRITQQSSIKWIVCCWTNEEASVVDENNEIDSDNSEKIIYDETGLGLDWND